MNRAVFLNSYWEAISQLETPEEQNKMFWAIINYQAYGEEPELEGVLSLLWTVIKPNCDSTVSKYNKAVENGKRGGAPKGNQNAKKETTKNNLSVELKQPTKTTKNNPSVKYKQPVGSWEITQNNLKQAEEEKEKEKEKENEIEKETEKEFSDFWNKRIA